MESSYFHTASVSLWTKGLLSSFHPWSTPHWNSSWLLWLLGYLMMIAWHGLTQNFCLWLPYIYLLRTMRSHTLQSDCSSRHSPSQWWLWGLRHHNVPLCPSTWVSRCWWRPWYNFLTPDTSVCLLLGGGDSGAWYFFYIFINVCKGRGYGDLATNIGSTNEKPFTNTISNQPIILIIF